MKNLFIVTVLSLFFFYSCDKKTFVDGCTDPLAYNYNSSADNDDESCVYSGCLDSTAINYNPIATINDSSCIYDNINTNIIFNFSHNVDGNTVSTDDLSHTNLAGENYNVLTLKYLISDIKLISDDSEILLNSIHFVDFSDPSTMFIDSDIIENGSYTLQFRFGLDSTTNVTNSFVNETFHTSMAWPEMMGGGYHYMKLEGSYTNDSTFYNTHTGPTMGMDHSFLCSFDIPININNSTNNLEYAIEMNINNWYGPELVNLEPAIMMNMPTQMNLMMNGMMGVFNLQGLLD